MNTSTPNTKPYERTQFTIRIRDFNNGRMFVEVINSPEGRMRRPEPVVFNWHVLPYIKKLSNPLKEGEMTQSELIEMGQMLGDMLFPTQVRRMFMKSWEKVYNPIPPAAKNEDASEEKKGTEHDDTDEDQQKEMRGMRIILELDDEKLSLIPWEYAYFMEYKHMRKLRLDPEDRQEIKKLDTAIRLNKTQRKKLQTKLDQDLKEGLLEKAEAKLKQEEEKLKQLIDAKKSEEGTPVLNGQSSTPKSKTKRKKDPEIVKQEKAVARYRKTVEDYTLNIPDRIELENQDIREKKAELNRRI